MKQHELWRHEYHSNRYMRDLTNEQLLARAGHLSTNSFVHAEDGRVAMKAIDLIGDSSGIQRYTHVLEEIALRGIDAQDQRVIDAMRVPQPKSPKVMRAIKTLAGRKWPENIIVKFGKRKYMADLLLAGRGRVSPATSYGDESLGYARADNESCVTGFLDPADSHRFMVINDEPGHSFGSDVDVPYLGSVPISIRANTDFYVYCLAESTDARLFDDFPDADACVVITRPDEFKVRVWNAVSAELPGWKFIAGPVLYFDPFFCHVRQDGPALLETLSIQLPKGTPTSMAASETQR